MLAHGRGDGDAFCRYQSHRLYSNREARPLDGGRGTMMKAPPIRAAGCTIRIAVDVDVLFETNANSSHFYAFQASASASPVSSRTEAL